MDDNILAVRRTGLRGARERAAAAEGTGSLASWSLHLADGGGFEDPHASNEMELLSVPTPEPGMRLNHIGSDLFDRVALGAHATSLGAAEEAAAVWW